MKECCASARRFMSDNKIMFHVVICHILVILRESIDLLNLLLIEPSEVCKALKKAQKDSKHHKKEAPYSSKQYQNFKKQKHDYRASFKNIQLFIHTILHTTTHKISKSIHHPKIRNNAYVDRFIYRNFVI